MISQMTFMYSDGSTVGQSGTGAAARSREPISAASVLPALTVLYHPDLERIGELAGRLLSADGEGKATGQRGHGHQRTQWFSHREFPPSAKEVLARDSIAPERRDGVRRQGRE